MFLPLHRLAALGFAALAGQVGSTSDLRLAVIVHPDNPTVSLSLGDLERLFKAETRSWSNKTNVVLYLPTSDTPEKALLLSRVYHMSEGELKKHWLALIYQNRIADQPNSLPSSAVMLKVVEKTKGAMTVVDLKDVPDGARVKLLAVEGKHASEEGYLLAAKGGSMAALTDPVEGALVGSKEDDHLPRTFPAAMRLPQQEGHAAQPQSGPGDGRARLLALEDRVAELELEAVTGSSDSADYARGPLLKLRGFGHVTLSARESDGGVDATSNEFALGGLDLFLTSQLSERFSFLNETVFEPTAEGEYVLDVERVILRYFEDDSLSIQVGRFHTTLAWWNETFHHGEWLQTSVGRPQVLSFEDDGGLLPVHLLGLVVNGTRPIGESSVHYTFEVGNGRGPTADPPQIAIDANDSKALNLALAFDPSAVPGLRVGANVYLDRIPANDDADSGPVHAALDEAIAGLFVAYERNGWRGAAEFFSIAHDGEVDTDSSGWYVELGRRMGNWTPYVRVDTVEVDDADTFFPTLDDQTTTALGVRHDLTSWAALKLQLEHSEVDAASGGVGTDVDALVLQAAFTF